MAKKRLKLSTFQIGTPAKRGQGLRLGTVRYPPRGVRKSEYVELGLFDVWLPSVAPSRALLQRFRAGGYSAAAFRKFCASYERELLGTAEGRQTVEFLALLATRIPISIGCHCSDERRCHRSQLKKMIERAAMSSVRLSGV